MLYVRKYGNYDYFLHEIHPKLEEGKIIEDNKKVSWNLFTFLFFHLAS